jgi:hypothetical protein
MRMSYTYLANPTHACMVNRELCSRSTPGFLTPQTQCADHFPHSKAQTHVFAVVVHKSIDAVAQLEQ